MNKNYKMNYLNYNNNFEVMKKILKMKEIVIQNYNQIFKNYKKN